MENHFVRYFSGLGKEMVVGTPNYSVNVTVLNGFLTVDNNWTIKYCNKAVGNLLGVISGGMLGKNFWQVLGPIIPPEFYDISHRVFLKENPDHFEEYLGQMGHWFDVILYHCDDRVSISFKSNQRTPKAEDLQLQLIRLNGLYRVITELTNDCLWEWNLVTKEIFWIDGGHERVFGYQIENALIPQSFWEDQIHPEDKERVLACLNNIKDFDSEFTWEQEYRFKKADGNYAYVVDRARIIRFKALNELRMIGTTQDISARKLLELELMVETSKKKKAISAECSYVQEKERLEIADDLNENLCPTLCAAKLYIECARKNEEKGVEYLIKSSGQILNVINEIRTVYKKLRMPGMYQGLYESVRLLINKQNLLYPVNIEFNVNGIDEEDLDGVLQLDLYRMIRELVDNIIKHARATHAWIDISRHGDNLTLVVSDNGQGCDLLKIPKGSGNTRMLACADLYGSRAHTTSSPGKGYLFSIDLPLSGRLKVSPQLLSDYND